MFYESNTKELCPSSSSLTLLLTEHMKGCLCVYCLDARGRSLSTCEAARHSATLTLRGGIFILKRAADASDGVYHDYSVFSSSLSFTDGFEKPSCN